MLFFCRPSVALILSLFQLLVAEEESQKQQHYGMVQELLKDSNNLREELQNLRCLTKIKAEERGQKHRELLRAQVRFTYTHACTQRIICMFILDAPLVHFHYFSQTCIFMCK